MTQNTNNKRIAKNTLTLYFRQILTLIIGLYTVRIVLDVLDIEDYGIYTVIGGSVALLSFMTNTVASATQRFFSFAIGENDQVKLNKIFIINGVIYIAISLIAFILFETIGFWLVKNQLKIPLNRIDSALFVYHFSVLSFLVSIIRAPFTAMIIAHEDMQYFAYISILQASLKLIVVFLLTYISFDKLELYSVLIFIVTLLNTLITIIICYMKYKEVQIKTFYWDSKILSDVLNFTGWTLFGSLTTVIRTQGITILLNQLFTPVIVTARAIAVQISSQVNMFSSSFNVGLYPPIIKSYANKNYDEMFSLIHNGSKITFFLMWILGLPLLLEMDSILNFWLTKVPNEAILFSRLAILESLINTISSPIANAARAPGKMKYYELILGTVQILILIAAWTSFKFGAEAYFVFIIAIIANIIMLFIRLLIVNRLINLDILKFIKLVILPVLSVIVISLVLSFSIKASIDKSIINSLIIIFASAIISSVSMYYIGIDQELRLKIKSIVLNRFSSIIKKNIK